MGVYLGKPAVFLDRDGVLNQAVVRDGKPFAPLCPEDMVLIPGVAECLHQLKAAGFDLVCVTNQPEVSRGKLSLKDLEAMHAWLRRQLPLDEVMVCPHDDRDECPCRKPKPGLILEAWRRRGLDLRNSFLIGDRWRDIDAAHAAGIRSVFLDYGYRDRLPALSPDATVRTLQEAAAWILTRSRSQT